MLKPRGSQTRPHNPHSLPDAYSPFRSARARHLARLNACYSGPDSRAHLFHDPVEINIPWIKVALTPVAAVVFLMLLGGAGGLAYR